MMVILGNMTELWTHAYAVWYGHKSQRNLHTIYETL